MSPATLGSSRAAAPSRGRSRRRSQGSPTSCAFGGIQIPFNARVGNFNIGHGPHKLIAKTDPIIVFCKGANHCCENPCHTCHTRSKVGAPHSTAHFMRDKAMSQRRHTCHRPRETVTSVTAVGHFSASVLSRSRRLYIPENPGTKYPGSFVFIGEFLHARVYRGIS